MKKIAIIFLLLFLIKVSYAEVLFPGVTGEALIDSIILHYKSYSNLGYNDGRDTLYGIIDKVNDSLRGVYTGFTIYMDPYADPSSDAYNKGINCEHTWPQSLGADTGLPEGDLHHLYPSEIGVNGARGSLPFGEIDDDQTDKWFRDDDTIYSVPTSNIDEYSELLTNVRFEPREDHKGRVARSMYYFFTMYRDYYLAEDSDTSWWKEQRDILYQWHKEHPPTEGEINRTYKIAEYQEDKPNPFVIDTTLIGRAYYPDDYSYIEIARKENNSIENKDITITQLTPYSTAFYIDAGQKSRDVYLYDIAGKKVAHTQYNSPGKYFINVKLQRGIYFILIKEGNNNIKKKVIIL